MESSVTVPCVHDEFMQALEILEMLICVVKELL